MKIGLTTYSSANKDFREQLSSMLKNGIKPDFIIIHYGGIYQFFKAFHFLKKNAEAKKIKKYLFSLSHRKNKTVSYSQYRLNEEDSKLVNEFISSAKIINTKGINSAETIKTIRALGNTVIACNSGKLNSEVLGISNAIFLNVHASKLPMYRGMNNVEWAVWENNDVYSTIHRISQNMDEGDILYQEKINTADENLKTISEYRGYCFYKSNELMGKALRAYLDKKISFTKQKTPQSPLSQYYIMHPILKEHLQKKVSGR